MTVELAPPIERVSAEAQSFLDYIVASADDLGVELPAKQYITTGEAVHDCEQVAVTVTGLTTGMPGEQGLPIGNCKVPWTATFDVDIVRCGPTASKSGTVTAARLTAAVEKPSMDTTVLMDAVQRKVDERFGGLIGTVFFLPPAGGFVATRLSVQLVVN